MRALLVGLMLMVPFAARAADEVTECLADCASIEKMCTDECTKKVKNGASVCKPQCKAVADACKKECKAPTGGGGDEKK